MSVWDIHPLKVKFNDEGLLQNFKLQGAHSSTKMDLAQIVIIRSADAVSNPYLLYRFGVVEQSDKQVIYNVSGNDPEWSARLTLEKQKGRVKFKLKVNGSKPIWMAEWKLGGLHFHEVQIPALGGRVIKPNMPEGQTESYKYPFWWNAQFIIGMAGECGIMLRVEDTATTLKLIRVGKENQTFALTYGYEAKAPLSSKSMEFVWYLEAFEGQWKSAVDRHASWLEEKCNTTKLNEKPTYPEWAEKINFILEVWGANRNTVKVWHTFDQMIPRIEQFSRLYDCEKTLLYLPGFAENGIDSHAPDYNPSPQCGGPEKFGQLVQRAHELGYRVMIHTNVLALTYSHPMYEKLKKNIVIDAFGRPQGWGMDIDGDWLAEPYFAYMNPGTKAWGDLMEKNLGVLINSYQLDAVFLDQTLLAFNVSNGPDFMQGMIEHIERLQNAFPDVLFAGEGIAEHTAKVLPMAQIHGIDSLPNVHGADQEMNWVQPHALLSYLFRRYTKLTAHLLTRHPSHPDFEKQETIYTELDVVPVLCLYNNEQELESPELFRMLERAKKI